MDFKRIGLKKDEVGCIRLEFSKKSIGEMLIYTHTLDIDLNVIYHHNDFFGLSIFKDRVTSYEDNSNRRVDGLMDLDFLTQEEMYKLHQKVIREYRSNKVKG